MKYKVNAFSCPKIGETPEDNFDRYLCACYRVEHANESSLKEEKKGIFHLTIAVADGVSMAFFPGIWSELLVNSFCMSPKEWLSHSFNNRNEPLKSLGDEWDKQVKAIVDKSDKYYVRNKYNDRASGSATFVGCRLSKKEDRLIDPPDSSDSSKKSEEVLHSMDIGYLGDSALVYIKKKTTEEYDFDNLKVFSTVKKTEEGEYVFDNFPEYLDSRRKGRGELKYFNLGLSDGIVLLMTDAIAAWFLKNPKNALEKMRQWDSQDNFQAGVDAARADGKNPMDNDDTTMVLIELAETDIEGFEKKEFEKPKNTPLEETTDKPDESASEDGKPKAEEKGASEEANPLEETTDKPD